MFFEAPVGVPIFRKHRRLFVCAARESDHGCLFVDRHKVWVVADGAEVVGNPDQVFIG